MCGYSCCVNRWFAQIFFPTWWWHFHLKKTVFWTLLFCSLGMLDLHFFALLFFALSHYFRSSFTLCTASSSSTFTHFFFFDFFISCEDFFQMPESPLFFFRANSSFWHWIDFLPFTGETNFIFFFSGGICFSASVCVCARTQLKLSHRVHKIIQSCCCWGWDNFIDVCYIIYLAGGSG